MKIWKAMMIFKDIHRIKKLANVRGFLFLTFKANILPYDCDESFLKNVPHPIPDALYLKLAL